jgi:pimeloyl-ACP methyl ester carboxylesterase
MSVLPLYTAKFAAEMAAHLFPEAAGCKRDCGRVRTDDDRLPWNARGRYGGWGGYEFFETDPGHARPPIVFVHGNRRDACDWERHAAYLLERGFGGDELWAITFADATTTHAKMVDQLDHFIDRVRDETGSEAVSVVAHSLGVTGVRYWMDQRDRAGWVDTFVAIAGANHGVSLCAGPDDADLLGDYSAPCQFIGYECAADPEHPLAKLNEGDEVPPGVQCYTIRGAYDHYYWHDSTSPTLAGADENVLLWTDHDGTRRCPETKALLYEWLA